MASDESDECDESDVSDAPCAGTHAQRGWRLAELERPADILADLLQARDAEPPTRLLQLADRWTGYTAVIANLSGAERRMADWRGFGALVRQLESGTGDVFTVVRRLRRLQQAEIEVPRPRLEAGDAVALMTIHAAKGLEWPVVVVPDVTRGAPNSANRVLFDPELGVGLRLADGDGAVQKPALFSILEARRKRREEAEARRLLYVAMTRARDHLLLTAPDDCGGLLELLRPGLSASGVACVTIPTDMDVGISAPPDLPLPPVPERVMTAPAGPGLFEMPATALCEYAVCPKRVWFRWVEGHPGIPTGDGYARRVGALVHLALDRQMDDADLLGRFDPLLPLEKVKESLALARCFHESPAFAEVREQIERREERVRYPVGRLALIGSVDALGPGFVLDYKTDAEVAPERHRLQLGIYAAATRRPAAHVAYLRHDRLHTFAPGELAEATQQVKTFAAQIVDGEFGARPSAGACAACLYAPLCPESIFGGAGVPAAEL